VVLVRVDNINSQLIAELKKDLLANNCYFFYIKNSLARKALELRNTEWNVPGTAVHELYQKIGRRDIPGLDLLSENFRDVNGCIFANGNLAKVAELLSTHTLASNGYSGYVADLDVIVPAGPTNIDIKMTNFFQKQSIPTKVENKKIKIEKDVVLVATGEVVNGTHLKIIELLELCPFRFRVQIKLLWDQGNVFGKEVVYTKDEDTLKKFSAGVNFLNALSLETGFATEGSISHSVSRVAKGLANVAFVTETTEPLLASLVGFLKNPNAMLAQPVAATGKAVAKVEEKKVEEVVEDVNLGGGLFGDEEEDW